jgi:hypothetical protein
VIFCPTIDAMNHLAWTINGQAVEEIQKLAIPEIKKAS